VRNRYVWLGVPKRCVLQGAPWIGYYEVLLTIPIAVEPKVEGRPSALPCVRRATGTVTRRGGELYGRRHMIRSASRLFVASVWLVSVDVTREKICLLIPAGLLVGVQMAMKVRGAPSFDASRLMVAPARAIR
jgi:hypothetical protein